MKRYNRNLLLKSLCVYIMTAVVLLCPSSPIFSYSGEASLIAEEPFSMDHSSSTNTGSADSHSGSDSHSIALLPGIDFLAALASALVLLVVTLLRKRLILSLGVCTAKLNYYLCRYRLSIKPKFERIILRWLNLLGGTVALNF